jgi:sugar phosphate isomerase/epimerase
MKLSMDTVSYAGYFTDGEHVPIEEAMTRAAKVGFDAIDVFAHRPMAFPMDLDEDRRKKIVDHAKALDLAMPCVECCTNYMTGNHALVFPQEKEILYTREAIKLAADMGIPLVRILAGFIGYFMNPRAQSGYGNPAFESRSMRVSQNKDWLEQWHAVKHALREVALMAQDAGVILALQTHPEITNNNEETLEMLDEVGVDSLKVGLDLPLMESQDPEFIRNTVLSMKDLMVHSHSISIVNKRTVGGAVFGWDEVTPGSEKDTCDWETFFKACKEIGYKGYLAHEQCSPIIVKDHKIAGLDDVDRRNQAAFDYLKGLLKRLDYYTGTKG